MNKLLIIDNVKFDRDIMGCIFGATYSMAFAENIEKAEIIMKWFKPGVVFFELRQPNINQLSILIDTINLCCPDSALIVSVSINTKELERYARRNRVFYYLIRPSNLREIWESIEWGFKNVNSNNIKKGVC